MKWLLVVLLAVVPFATADAQKRCKKGIPCGNSCIAANKVCRIGSARPPAVAAAPAQAGSASAAAYAEVRDAQFVGSTRGTTFYRVGCAGAKRLSVANLRYFKNEDAAKQAGYKRSVQNGC